MEDKFVHADGSHKPYALGHAPDELQRLIDQARFIGDLTAHVLRSAGIKSGMRVLDVGCGAGDVSFLAATLVGLEGSVIGVDKSPEAIHTARMRASAAGLANVRFTVQDFTELEIEEKVDAVIGRLVLMYLADPAAALRGLTRHLKRRGVIAFQEIDIEACYSAPVCPLLETALDRVKRAFAVASPQPRAALMLGSIFEDAGLPAPQMIQGARVERGPDSQIYQMLAGITRTLLPVMERSGIATAKQVDVDTLAQRVRDEVVACGATVISPGYIGAWARL